MAITRQKVNRGEGTKTIRVPFGNEFLQIGYTREKYTPQFEKELNEKMNAGLPGDMLATFLLSLLKHWDLKDFEEKDIEKAQNYLDKKNKERGDKPEISLGEISVEEWGKAGIKLVDVPLTAENMHNLLTIEGIAKIVEKLSEDQRPNQPSSDFTSNT
jgi:hypothetical protein